MKLTNSAHNGCIMKPIARFVLPTILLAATSALACMNDRDSDSLALQARQLPETLRVITGRFERNPPLYYQMRVERSQAQLQHNPRQFALYDDIGVAQDKLNRDDEALQTMERKRQVLLAFNAKDKANAEAWYRYFANAGTFRAHRWLKAGAPKAQLGEMKTARAQIARAIEIKPDAHFGRERYQLMTMDWIIARKSGTTKRTLGEWLALRDKWKPVNGTLTLQSGHRARAVEGLAGLIVLGGAWQSPDVFEALAAALETRESVTLRHVALLRAKELLKDGKKSLSDESAYSMSIGSEQLGYRGIGVSLGNEERLDALFAQLRSEADQWNEARQDWMTAKLKSGAHPDTNADFWNGYRENAPPSLDIRWDDNRAKGQKVLWTSVAVATFFTVLIIGGAIFLLLKLIARRSIA